VPSASCTRPSRDAALPDSAAELLAALDVAELPVVEKWFDRT